MRVMLSIKPQYANKIFDGTKSFEYRKSVFNGHDIRKVVVYASSPVSRVIGEFDIEEIICETPEALWEKTNKDGGVSKEFYFQYFSGRDRAYAIKVNSPKLYGRPKMLSEYSISSPPQSFVYID